MNYFDLHGYNGVALQLRRLSHSLSNESNKALVRDAADDIESRHDSDKSYGVLRVALRNALFRVTRSDTDFCPSKVFRDIEAGKLGVAEATDVFEDMLKRLRDESWERGVDDVCKKVYDLSQEDTDRVANLIAPISTPWPSLQKKDVIVVHGATHGPALLSESE